jgi:hypothetical protein
MMTIFDDLNHGFCEIIFNGCFPSRAHDYLAGELVKARLLKASDRFDEALAVINSTLRRLPKHPEALFLKAQILREGYSNDREATACLKKVIRMKRMRYEKDELFRQWSENLLQEILEVKQVRNRRTEADKRRG